MLNESERYRVTTRGLYGSWVDLLTDLKKKADRQELKGEDLKKNM